MRCVLSSPVRLVDRHAGRIRVTLANDEAIECEHVVVAASPVAVGGHIDFFAPLPQDVPEFV